MNSEAVIGCINESCKTWHDNNLSLLAAALLLRHFYVPSSDGTENHQDNENISMQDATGALTTNLVSEVNGVLNGTDLRSTNSTANINNLITPSSTSFANADKNNQNKTSTINALIHVTSGTPSTSPPPLDDTPKVTPSSPSSSSPPTPLTPNKIPSPTPYPSTPTNLTITATSTPLQDSSLTTTTTTTITSDSIHHPTELISVTEHNTTNNNPTNNQPAPDFIPVNATVPTRHVKECGHNIICILQKNNFSLSTSKKVSAASQQVYVNHVYPPIDVSKSVLEVIATVKEYWKLQMAPSPLSFCGLVTYMKNLTVPPTDPNVNALYPHVPMYPPLALCPPSPAVTPGPRRKRAKIEPVVQVLPDTSLLVQQLQTCSDHNKTLQNRISSFENDLKSIHQICLQQECELRNISQGCLNAKNGFQNGADGEIKVVPWPLGEKVVGVNHTLWQGSFTPHTPPNYWFREDQHILDVINSDKEGDIVCGYHVVQDILLMKVDVEWLKKSFEQPGRKADEMMQQLEQTYGRFDGYLADTTGEVGLFPKGFAKIARKMSLHRKFA